MNDGTTTEKDGPLFDPWREGKRPTLGADNMILTKRGGKWWVLLVERGHEPFKGKWCFPGGFMEWGESCDQAAARELREETSLSNVDLQLLGVFSRPGRDPRGTIVSIAYIGIVEPEAAAKAVGGDDAAKAEWYPLDDCPPLAFDHGDILTAGKAFLSARNL